MRPRRRPRSDRRSASLLGDVSKDLSDLVRQEIALAKAEATQSATRVGKGAGLLGGAGVAGHFVLLFLSIALWWGLGNSIGRGWSALIVAAVWARRRRRTCPVGEEPARSPFVAWTAPPTASRRFLPP